MRNGNKLTTASLMVGDWYKNIEFDECRIWRCFYKENGD